MEAKMVEVGTAYVLKNILTTREIGPPMLPNGEYGTGFNPDIPYTLSSWLTEEDDLAYFTLELTAPWTGVKTLVPVKFITGELDMVYTSLGMKEYIYTWRRNEGRCTEFRGSDCTKRSGSL
ncbi:putative soluble epoxide hydrolase [Medicago truncatula]|uniref:Putative soluble epoxide hydrolase n=1 Tax=Medicago truncatula TaxID=3880 RepID=A0A396H957_MEDTR|nr:putative soluble epoxide hydrolase [Medicago truncatula]